MFLAIRERLERGREEGGFTLIELMVVVLIIAILIAIAIPTFLGARKRAQDKQAQSNLRNALTAEKTYYVDHQDYASDDVAAELADLQGIESSLQWDTTDASQRGVDVTAPAVAGTDVAVILQSDSKSGTTFCMLDIATATATHQPGTYFDKDTTAPLACPAENAATWTADAAAGW
ncbi:MAG: prepilin-type N-terminal cleavage/methylation domain-containing protein [Actinomycetota bacterium]